MGHELRVVTRQFHNSRRGSKGTHKRMNSMEGRVNRKKSEHLREEQDALRPKYGWEKELLVEEAEKGSRKQ